MEHTLAALDGLLSCSKEGQAAGNKFLRESPALFGVKIFADTTQPTIIREAGFSTIIMNRKPLNSACIAPLLKSLMDPNPQFRRFAARLVENLAQDSPGMVPVLLERAVAESPEGAIAAMAGLAKQQVAFPVDWGKSSLDLEEILPPMIGLYFNRELTRPQRTQLEECIFVGFYCDARVAVDTILRCLENEDSLYLNLGGVNLFQVNMVKCVHELGIDQIVTTLLRLGRSRVTHLLVKAGLALCVKAMAACGAAFEPYVPEVTKWLLELAVVARNVEDSKEIDRVRSSGCWCRGRRHVAPPVTQAARSRLGTLG